MSDQIIDNITRGDMELGRGRHTVAEGLYRAAMDQLPPDASDHPAELRALRATLAERLGDCALRAHHFDDAKTQFEMAAAIWEILIDEVPTQRDWLRNHGLLAARLGTLASSQANHLNAITWLQRSV